MGKQTWKLTLQAWRAFRHTPWHCLCRCICMKGSRDDAPLGMISGDKLCDQSLIWLTRTSLLLTLQAAISQQLQRLSFVLNSTRYKMPASIHKQEVQQGPWGSSPQVTLLNSWIGQSVGLLSCLKGCLFEGGWVGDSLFWLWRSTEISHEDVIFSEVWNVSKHIWSSFFVLFLRSCEFQLT